MRSYLCAGLILAGTWLGVSVAIGQDFQPTVEDKINRPGFDYHTFNPPGPDARYCQSACLVEAQCRSWVYQMPQATADGRPICSLKFDVPPQQANRADTVAGVVRPPPNPEAGTPHKISYRHGDVTGELTKANGTIWQETVSSGAKFNFRTGVETRSEILFYDVARDMYLRADLAARKLYFRTGRGGWTLHSEIVGTE
jgi:hypothetical protein